MCKCIHGTIINVICLAKNKFVRVGILCMFGQFVLCTCIGSGAGRVRWAPLRLWSLSVSCFEKTYLTLYGCFALVYYGVE